MKFGDYHIERYSSEHKESIINLLSSEWKHYSRDYFEWKYQNPYCKEVMGWVTIFSGKVVGFRGLMARNFSQLDGKIIKIFTFGDGFVHKDHRRKGIFSKLNQYSIKDLANYWAKEKVPGFVYTMSSNKSSTPVYLKMGWKAISKRNMLVYQNFSGLILNKGSSKKHIKNLINGLNHLINIIRYSDEPELGEYKLLITSKVYSYSMADLYQRCIENDRLVQIRDKLFYDWRLNNPNEKYKVSYLVNAEDKLVAYAIFQERNPVCCLIDYCYSEYREFKILMRNSISRFSSNLIFTLGFGISKNVLEDLNKLGFKEPRIIYKLFPNAYDILRNNLYFIVHPVSINPKETDWMVDNYDLRDIHVWKLNMIDDDGV